LQSTLSAAIGRLAGSSKMYSRPSSHFKEQFKDFFSVLKFKAILRPELNSGLVAQESREGHRQSAWDQSGI